jgi:VCBS repeat protein/List-Bact-rpt repeat protein/FG-GAP repeat protein
MNASLVRIFVTCVAVLCLSALGWGGQFQLPPQYFAGIEPLAPGQTGSVAAGDFNGDGKADLAVTHGDLALGSIVTILLGNGDGTLQAPVNYQTGFGPGTVVVADLNADGNQDLAIICSGVFLDGSDGSISVLFGNGDGTFPARITIPLGGQAVSIAAADFNGDGAIDIVYGINGTISVLLNNGNGTFGLPVDSGVSAGVVLAAGDVNQDGKADVVASTSLSTITVLLGNGDGTFQSGVNYTVAGDPTTGAAAIADFDGDGRPDVAVLCNAYLGTETISILMGNGDGTLKQHVDYAFGSELGNHLGSPAYGNTLVAADFDGDGHFDLAAAIFYNNTVGILFGNGNGTFRGVSYYLASQAHSVAAPDLNNDGKPDLVVGDYGDAAVSILLNSGTRFPTAGFYRTGHAPGAVAIADLNGDGKKDLVVANGGLYSFSGPDNTISVLLGNGDGTFQGHVDYPSGANPFSVAVADLNGDGKADVVTANISSNTVSIFLNRGDGTLRPRVDYETSNAPASVVIADFNGDGKPDLAVAADGSSAVSVFLGNGDGTFRPRVDYGTGAGPISIAVGDFNGDGKVDLATASCVCPGGGSVSVLLGKGDGTFGPHVDHDAGGASWALAVGDFDGDNHDDIAVAYGGPVCNPTGCFSDSGIGILLGRGDGTLQSVVKYAGGAGSWVAAADFNADGKLDLAVADGDFAESSIAFGNSVSVFWGNGDGTFRPHIEYSVGAGSYALAAGDLNGDHKADLAVVAENFAGVAVLLNSATVPQFILSTGSTSPICVEESSPFGIGCASPLATFDSGTTVTLTANPGSGSRFTSWSGDCSGSGACILDMISDRSVTANVTPDSTTFTLSVNKSGNGVGVVQDPDYLGSVNCGNACSASFPIGTVVPLGGVAAPGNTFADFSGGGCSGAFDCYITMNSDVAVTATFTLPQGFHELKVKESGTGSGVITSSPKGINCTVSSFNGNSGACEAGFAGGTSITLSFNPDPGYVLVGWSGGGCSGTGNCVLTLTSDLTVTANLGPAPDFSISASDLSPGTVNPGGSATSNITVAAINGFSSAVALTCSVSPLPKLAPECSLNPGSVTLGTSSTLTVTTSPSTISLAPSRSPNVLYATWIGVFGLTWLGGNLVQRLSRRHLRALQLCCLLLTIGALQLACGGGRSNENPHGSAGTPSGIYTVTITGTSGSLQHTTSVTLTVQ